MRQTPLLERDREVVAATQAIADMREGHGRLIAVVGEAGVGKTRLLGHLRQLPQAADLDVFSAKGSDLERNFAFGVVRQLFEPRLVTASATERRRLLSGAARGAAPLFADDGSTTPDTDLAILHGLYWLTVGLAERPTLILVDDLHWSDEASLRYLTYLTPRLDGLPIFVVAVVRTGEQTTNQHLLQHLMAAPETTLLRPAPLTEAATATLLGTVLGRPVDPQFSVCCFRATAGNPLLLQALAGSLEREGIEPTAANTGRVLEVGPRAISHLVAERLAHATPEQLGVARAAAVLGPGASLPSIADLSAIDLLTSAESVNELVHMGLIESGPPTSPSDTVVSYAHPLIEAAVYDGMSPRERAEAHEQAADILAKRGVSPERVGAHLLKTPPGRGQPVVEHLQRAAATAEKRGSADAALAFLMRCLDERDDHINRQDLLTEAARVAVEVDLHTAVRLLEEAKTLTKDTSNAALIAAELGRAYGYLLEPDSAIDALYEALTVLPADDEDHRRRLEATLLVGAFVVPGRLDVVRRLPALKELPPHDSLGGLMLEAAIGEHETAVCDPNGPARARAALAEGRLVREANGEGALVCVWLTLLAADDPMAMPSLDDSIKQAHLHGSVRALAAAYCFRALGRVWRGQLADAETDAREALRLAQTGRVDMDPTFAGAYLADAMIEQGRLDEAATILRSVGVPGVRPLKPHYCALDSYARLLRLRGDNVAAWKASVEAGELWQSFGIRNPGLETWRAEASLALLALGRVDDARHQAQEDLDLAQRWGAPRALGRALRVIGQVTGGREGIESLERSTAVLADSGARLEHAKSLLELGAALRRGGRRTAAREALARALDEAEICGAPLTSDAARAELRTAGFRPRRHRLTGVEGLTPSERRIVEAAAAGATNREIAQSLFVTTKTVEVHLSSAFRKLGVSRRNELGRHLEA